MGLAANLELLRLPLLPGDLLAFVFPARMSLLQERHLIVPFTSSNLQDHIGRDHGLLVMEQLTVE